jgi:hypothetical protein
MALELILSGEPIININEDALSEWIEYREEKKKPLSALALKKTKNLLIKYGSSHQAHIVDTAIMNDWQGLHPVEMPKTILTSTKSTSLMDDLTDTSWAQ